MMKHSKYERGFAGLLAALVIGVGLHGCATPDKLTFENYSRLHERASSESEVEAAIGEPSSRLGSLWHYERPDKHLNVMIEFDNDGKIARKQWVDAMAPVWDDSSDPKEKE